VTRHRIGLRGLVAVLALAGTGCAGSLERARAEGPRLEAAPDAAAAADDRCERLDRQHRVWGAVAKGSAVLAGSAGVVTVPTEDATARAALAGGAVAAAAVAAAAVAVSEGAAESWARDCGARGGG
jgi:hypothetical protein